MVSGRFPLLPVVNGVRPTSRLTMLLTPTPSAPPPPVRYLLPCFSKLKVCFRKALNCLDWKKQEHHQRLAQSGPKRATDGPPLPPSRTEKTESRRRGAATLLQLGRFELLQNRSVRRASAFFKACLQESPWHASAQVRSEGFSPRLLVFTPKFFQGAPSSLRQCCSSTLMDSM